MPIYFKRMKLCQFEYLLDIAPKYLKQWKLNNEWLLNKKILTTARLFASFTSDSDQFVQGL